MEILEGAEAKVPAPAPEGPASIDRFEMTRRFVERDEEEKVEAAMALYEKAARARMPSEVQENVEITDPAQLEELEARSQELKLRQKCQDIAAWVMVDDLIENELDDEEE